MAAVPLREGAECWQMTREKILSIEEMSFFLIFHFEYSLQKSLSRRLIREEKDRCVTSN